MDKNYPDVSQTILPPELAMASGGDPVLDLNVPVAQSAVLSCIEPDAPLLAVFAAPNDPRRVFTFLPRAVEWAHLSLQNECDTIDVLMPDWFLIADAKLNLEVQSIDLEAMEEIGDFLKRRGGNVELFPIVRIANGIDKDQFYSNLAQTDMQASLVKAITLAAGAASAQGVCIDFGRFPKAQSAVVGSFLKTLNSTLSALKTETCVVLGAADEAWDSPHLKDAVDTYVLKMFEEPWLGSPAAPLAPDDWFAETTRIAIEHFGRDRLVVALGSHSMDWISGQAVPQTIAYSEAVARVAAANGRIGFSQDALNSYSTFVDDTGARHQLWMLDAASVHNQLTTLDELGVVNVGLWPLGGEDPAVWPLLAGTATARPELRQVFSQVPVLNYAHYVGEGPFIRIAARENLGLRSITFDDQSLKIIGQTYNELPHPVTIERYGRGSPNQVVLTFDDGPHPDYTDKILDLLMQTETPATFFAVGQNVINQKDVVRRMVDEGHEIGAHSFWHPHMDEITETRAMLEISLFQKLLAGVVGRGTVLFREPYQRSDGPLNISQSGPLRQAQAAGHVYVGSDVTPRDWEDITAEEIVTQIVDGLDQGGANIISLHDAGNDRRETVRAVPMIISTLRAQGYEFTTLSALLGMSRLEAMPLVEGSSGYFYGATFGAARSVGTVMSTIFFAAIIIGATRAIFVLVFAILRRRHRGLSGRYKPPVTVVIPAYNEEEAIISNIKSVLALNYPDLRIVVVDDGSSDETFPKMLGQFSRNPRVKIVAQLNRGKWSALNTALRAVDTEIVICIDADTRIDENAVTRLVAHFQDPFVGAVAGKVVVSNRTNLITRLQALEYITAQNIDRRAAEYLNAMLVVPGAIGAWRVGAINAAGGYSGDTLTEDADLTISVLRKGFRIAYEENAIAHTLAPPRIRQLLAQRLRWSLGMMQAGWKHRGVILEGRALGLIAIPDLLIFGYLFPILAPLADFFFLKLLFEMGQSYWAGGALVSSDMSRFMLIAYIMLPLMDVVTAMTAMAFDHRENPALVLLFPVQRFFYRQLLYFSVIRALLRAGTGRLMKWTKAHRMAAATPHQGSQHAP
ncbi:MAG: glycosyltransferase [Rhodobacteraceae bacterium]|nr:glycosyltransferase [Paracoccaceae bacterium]